MINLSKEPQDPQGHGDIHLSNPDWGSIFFNIIYQISQLWHWKKNFFLVAEIRKKFATIFFSLL